MEKIAIEHGLILCEIPREKIEAFDFEDILKFSEELKSKPRTYINKVAFVVSGYDEDSRELYEIKEVREYFSFLDKIFPYWLFFLNLDFPTDRSPIVLLICCLVDFEILESGNSTRTLKFSMPKVQEFVKSRLPYFNAMMDKGKISHKKEQAVFYKMIDHVYGAFR